MRKTPLQSLSRRKFIDGASKSAIAIGLAPILQACSDGSDNRLAIVTRCRWNHGVAAPETARGVQLHLFRVDG